MTAAPQIHKSCFIADSAVIMGDVTINKDCGVYPHAVIRGDQNTITIGERSNVQDCCVIHVDSTHPAIIGKEVSIGHAAMIHGATIQDTCLVGIHATILNGATIGTGSIIGAGAVVTADTIIPKHSLVLGVPAKVIKTDPLLVEKIKRNAEIYTALSRRHREKEFLYYQK